MQREDVERLAHRLDRAMLYLPDGDTTAMGEEAAAALRALLDRAERDASFAAAPQPAPVEREALVEVIRSVVPLSVKHLRTLADALLARGLRLPSGEAKPRRCAECDCEGGEYECTWIKPGPDRDNALQQLADLGQQADRASETMAWAVVGEDGTLLPATCGRGKPVVDQIARAGQRVVRVAIRVVEDSDDAA